MTEMALVFRSFEIALKKWMWDALKVVLIGGTCLAAIYVVGPFVENHIPVLKDQSIPADSVMRVGDRLCMNWHFEKTREAIPQTASAKLFVSNQRNPLIIGLEHYDGTPLGMPADIGAVAPTGQPWSTEICLSKLPPEAWTADRLGVYFILTYKWITPWTTQINSPWIDFPKKSTAGESKTMAVPMALKASNVGP